MKHELPSDDRFKLTAEFSIHEWRNNNHGTLYTYLERIATLIFYFFSQFLSLLETLYQWLSINLKYIEATENYFGKIVL